jgi:hypothetical protein
MEPSNDAIDYKTREKRDFFLRSYVKTADLDKAKKSNCYYIIGEKGSGKTALAYYFQACSPDAIAAKLLSISETQYKKFTYLKINNRLQYSDYAQIWRPTLLYLMAQHIKDKSKHWTHRIPGNRKFKLIEDAISAYDANSLIPELDTVQEFFSSLSQNTEIGADSKPLKAKSGEARHNSTKMIATDIRHSLGTCEIQLKEGISSLKFNNDVVLFLDGIDAKPSGVKFSEFIECLKGLAEACWQINADYFQDIKDSKGRLRIVMLMRPDVFDALDIYNSNSRINDNSVVLDWTTTEDTYHHSNLWNVVNAYFECQNPNKEGWDAYFPEKDQNYHNKAFTSLLKRSFQRPRDYFTAIKKVIDFYKKTNRNDATTFNGFDFEKPEFTDSFSSYILGEVKNYANYYMSNTDFEKYLAFFHYLNGAYEFSQETFSNAFTEFRKWAIKQELNQQKFLQSHEHLLQFWYDVNVLGYEEIPDDGSFPYIHWSFRDRSTASVMPKIKLGVKYRVNMGVAKALNIGKQFAKPSFNQPQNRHTGKQHSSRRR